MLPTLEKALPDLMLKTFELQAQNSYLKTRLAEAEAKHQMAYAIVCQIAEQLPTRDVTLRYWYNKRGELLRTLDEVVNAFLADELRMR